MPSCASSSKGVSRKLRLGPGRWTWRNRKQEIAKQCVDSFLPVDLARRGTPSVGNNMMDQPGSSGGSEASVNQQAPNPEPPEPLAPDLSHPLLDDNTRSQELNERGGQGPPSRWGGGLEEEQGGLRHWFAKSKWRWFFWVGFKSPSLNWLDLYWPHPPLGRSLLQPLWELLGDRRASGRKLFLLLHPFDKVNQERAIHVQRNSLSSPLYLFFHSTLRKKRFRQNECQQSQERIEEKSTVISLSFCCPRSYKPLDYQKEEVDFTSMRTELRYVLCFHRRSSAASCSCLSFSLRIVTRFSQSILRLESWSD
ncbi:hypothetical protein VNO77_50927 [Canavalia gladiata]|uniref:Uncharacterized protein n=1 Tax=Canavalia gladiata TaxID=3824 RepID=A0AAN9PF18_CANGL